MHTSMWYFATKRQFASPERAPAPQEAPQDYAVARWTKWTGSATLLDSMKGCLLNVDEPQSRLPYLNQQSLRCGNILRLRRRTANQRAS